MSKTRLEKLEYQRNYYNQNIIKKRLYAKERAHKPHVRNIQYIRLYGITLDEYERLATKQSNVCAICNQPETLILRGRIKRLHVDHCHITNKVRGLLCAKCNKALGLFYDKPELLQKAINYLNDKVMVSG